MTDTPDTTPRFDLTDPIYAAFCERNDLDLSNRALFSAATIASGAALDALAQQDYMIIKVGEIPPWLISAGFSRGIANGKNLYVVIDSYRAGSAQ
jgi:hypothetical protein